MRKHYDSLQAVLSHPFLSHPAITPPFITPCYYTPFYHTLLYTPWFITPPSWPLRAAVYHAGYARYHTPYIMPHPVMIFSKPKMLPPGCGFLRSMRQSGVLVCWLAYCKCFALVFTAVGISRPNLPVFATLFLCFVLIVLSPQRSSLQEASTQTLGVWMYMVYSIKCF